MEHSGEYTEDLLVSGLPGTPAEGFEDHQTSACSIDLATPTCTGTLVGGYTSATASFDRYSGAMVAIIETWQRADSDEDWRLTRVLSAPALR